MNTDERIEAKSQLQLAIEALDDGRFDHAARLAYSASLIIADRNKGCLSVVGKPSEHPQP